MQVHIPLPRAEKVAQGGLQTLAAVMPAVGQEGIVHIHGQAGQHAGHVGLFPASQHEQTGPQLLLRGDQSADDALQQPFLTVGKRAHQIVFVVIMIGVKVSQHPIQRPDDLPFLVRGLFNGKTEHCRALFFHKAVQLVKSRAVVHGDRVDLVLLHTFQRFLRGLTQTRRLEAQALPAFHRGEQVPHTLVSGDDQQPIHAFPSILVKMTRIYYTLSPGKFQSFPDFG